MPDPQVNWVARLAPLKVTAEAPERVFQGQDATVIADRLTLFFESRDNLTRHLSHFAGFSPNAKQADHIGACLRQGREFMRISRGADLATRPITLYYAMASYARALALGFRNPPLLDHFPSSHGLSIRSPLGQPMETLELSLNGTDGLFHRFVTALTEEWGSAAETRDGQRFWIHHDPIDPGALAFHSDLKGLLGRIIGIEDLYRETFDENPLNCPVDLKLADIGGEGVPLQAALVFRVPKGSNLDWLFGLHHSLREWRHRDPDNSLGDASRGETVLENLPPDLPRPATAEGQAALLKPIGGILPPFTKGQQGDHRLVAAVDAVSIPEPAIQLAAMFLLSCLARYRPDAWMRFASFSAGNSDSRLRALLEAVFYRAESVFPLQVLAALGSVTLVLWNGRRTLVA